MPIQSLASRTAVVGVSFKMSIFVTGFRIPARMRSTYMGLKRLQPWLSMPRRSLSSSTSEQSFASSFGRPSFTNAAVIKSSASFQEIQGLVSFSIGSLSCIFPYLNFELYIQYHASDILSIIGVIETWEKL